MYKPALSMSPLLSISQLLSISPPLSMIPPIDLFMLLHFQSSGDAPGDEEDDKTASVTTGAGGDTAGASVRERSATSRISLREVGT